MLPIFCGFATAKQQWLTANFKSILRQNRFKPFFINSLENPLISAHSANRIKGKYPIVVVHSQGFQHFMQSKIRCKHVVILNSFLNFCSAENTEVTSDRLIERQLQRMRYQFERNPIAIIQQFQKNAGYEHLLSMDATPNKAKLKQLKWQLKALEQPISIQSFQKKVLEKCTFVLQKNDPIVPEFRSNQLLENVSALKTVEVYRLDESVHLSTSMKFYEILRTTLKK